MNELEIKLRINSEFRDLDLYLLELFVSKILLTTVNTSQKATLILTSKNLCGFKWVCDL